MKSHFIEYLVPDPATASGWKCIGTQNVDNPDPAWKLGHAGQTDFVFTSPFEVEKGHRIVTIPASSSKPVAGRMMLQKLEGRKFKHPLDPQ